MDSFEEYVLTRGPALVRLARLLANDPHRAEDLVQEVLARAYPRWSRIARLDHPDEYLRRMLINLNNSWWRRVAHRREVVTSNHPERAGPGDPSMATVERDAMLRLVATLPHRQRCVLVLRFYEDLSNEEIARILRCSPVTVRTHSMRGLAALRDLINDNQQGG